MRPGRGRSTRHRTAWPRPCLAAASDLLRLSNECRTDTWRPACDRELAPLPGGAIPCSTSGPTRRSLYARRYASFRSAGESANVLVANCGKPAQLRRQVVEPTGTGHIRHPRSLSRLTPHAVAFAADRQRDRAAGATTGLDDEQKHARGRRDFSFSTVAAATLAFFEAFALS